MHRFPHVAQRLPGVRPAGRTGFTLIEMLVATGLVVLMLMLFARIFGDTVAIMRKQQSLIQNDQKARNLDTILRNDLAKMTFRQPSIPGVTGIVPLSANWPVDPNQQGFFYYSENDVENPLDDTIHFTLSQHVRTRAKDVSVFRGRGQRLARPFAGSSPFPDDNGNGTLDDTDLGTDADRNQPDYDDGLVDNNLGQSSAAEVCYFVRNGNLYRRVLLLREPQSAVAVSGFPTPPAAFSSQPGMGVNGSTYLTNGAGTNLVDRKFMRIDSTSNAPVYSGYSSALDAYGPTTTLSDFWNDFDYSAFNQWVDVNGDRSQDTFPVDRYELILNGVDGLLNQPGGADYPIALPQHRFGHRPALDPLLITAQSKALGGQPMEYLLSSVTSTGLPVGFIGRFTHAETSSSNPGTRFGYPGIVPQDPAPDSTGVVNPFLSPYAATWDANGDGIVDVLADGPRTGEDLLVSNVESFDIEVWDDGFVETDIDGDGVLDTWEDLNGDGVLNQYSGIWTDLGHDTTHPSVTASPYQSGLGYFRLANNQNVTYGPRNLNAAAGTFNRVYDTWHPRANVGAYAPLLAQRSGEAPYALCKVGGSAGNTLHRGRVGSEWAVNWPMLAGHYIFPGVSEDPNFNNSFDDVSGAGLGEDVNGNRQLDPMEDQNQNNALDPPEVDANGNGQVDHNEDLNHDGAIAPDDDGDMLSDEDKNGDGFVGLSKQDDWSYYYRVIGYRDTPIDVDGDGMLSAGEDTWSWVKRPEWLRRPGHVIYDGNVIWKCFDNRVPLQMIRITVRYRDPASGAPRQVSIVHSFVD